MKSFYQAGSIPDDEVLFGDGILWIVCKDGVAKIVIDPQYDNTISLEDIALRYPNVEIVIHEEALSGEVYRYDNYCDKEWWQTGQTRGYA